MKYILNVSFLIVILWTFSGCSTCTRTEQGSTSSEEKVTSSGAEADILIGELNVEVDETVLPQINDQGEGLLSAYPNTQVNNIAKPQVQAVREALSKRPRAAIV